ncbi:MAG: S8 family serine peptidase, partial [Sphingomonadaceae bacterium]
LIDRRGTCIFAATGNGGAKARAPFPAIMDTVNGITALDTKQRAYRYATPGRHVAAAAFGVKRLTAVPGGYRIASGTSFASAWVAGRASLLPQCSGSHDSVGLRRHIASQSVDLGQPGRDDIYGYGQFR